MFILSALLNNFESAPDWLRGALFIGLFGVYEPLCMTLGGTIGNRIRKIQVRQHKDESKRINIFQSYIRFFVKVLLGWLSFITIHMNNQKRALHDLASGSVLIQKK
ncbi:MAG: RDD family protein [Bacteroidia bacterium]